MVRAIPSCMLYTLIIHMDASFVYRGCEPTLLYIGGFYFSTLGNATAYPVHPVSDGGLKNFSFNMLMNISKALPTGKLVLIIKSSTVHLMS